MDEYLKFRDLVEKELIIKCDKLGGILAAYIKNPEAFALFSSYQSVAHGNWMRRHVPINENYYRGTPDWYFIEHTDGDYETPACYWFETLTEKKNNFDKFVKECDDILKEKEDANQLPKLWSSD